MPVLIERREPQDPMWFDKNVHSVAIFAAENYRSGHLVPMIVSPEQKRHALTHMVASRWARVADDPICIVCHPELIPPPKQWAAPNARPDEVAAESNESPTKWGGKFQLPQSGKVPDSV